MAIENIKQPPVVASKLLDALKKGKIEGLGKNRIPFPGPFPKVNDLPLEQRVKSLENMVNWLDTYNDQVGEILGYFNVSITSLKDSVSNLTKGIDDVKQSLANTGNTNKAIADLTHLFNNHGHVYQADSHTPGFVIDGNGIGVPVVFPGEFSAVRVTGKPKV